MLDQLRREIQTFLDELLGEADKLRRALVALGSRDREATPSTSGAPSAALSAPDLAPARPRPPAVHPVDPARSRPSADAAASTENEQPATYAARLTAGEPAPRCPLRTWRGLVLGKRRPQSTRPRITPPTAPAIARANLGARLWANPQSQAPVPLASASVDRERPATLRHVAVRGESERRHPARHLSVAKERRSKRRPGRYRAD